MSAMRYFFPLLVMSCAIVHSQSDEPKSILNPFVTFEKHIMEMVQEVRPSVVSIASCRHDVDDEDRMKFSGVVLDDAGHIITMASSVAKAKTICVSIESGEKCQAKVIGSDRHTNLAVIKVDLEGLRAVKKGDSSRLGLAAFLIVIGNPYGFPGTVSIGNVSGLGRTVKFNNQPLTGLIQTNAPINPGDAGGLAVDSRGRFIGIVFSTLARNRLLLVDRINFILPSNTVYWVADQLIRHGEVKRGWLGITVKDGFGSDGVVITEVSPQSPADEGGLQRGDRILAIDGRPVRNSYSLLHQVSHMVVGERLALTVKRQQRMETKPLVLGQKP